MRGLLVVPLLFAVLAGCVSEAPDPVDEPDVPVHVCEPTPFEDPYIRFANLTEDVIADVAGRAENQWDFSKSNVRSCSLAAIGHHDLREGDPHKYLGEIDFRGDLDLGAVAVLGNGETPMIYILDISNRSAPQVISTIEQDGTYIVDVKLGDNGDYLFAASQTVPGPGEGFGLADLEPTAPTGFTVYDIRDPANPTFVTTIADPQVGCHMLNTEYVGTTLVVACVSQQVRLHAFEVTPAGLAYITFVDYFPEGENGAPAPSGVPAVGDPTGGQLTQGPHDMLIQRDEVTNDLLMVVSHWGAGMRVVDLNDAPQATELGKWMGEGATHYAGNVHTAMMFYANGTRYIMASPEYTSGGNIPSLWLLDATDLSNPTLVGEWFHPGNHTSEGLYLTTHQWQVAPVGPDVALEDVKVYLTYNKGGIWVLGLQEMLEFDNQGAIKGFHLSRAVLDEATAVGNAVLSTWDVNLVDGYIYGSDRATGLWVFHYQGDADHPGDVLGDPRLTGFN